MLEFYRGLLVGQETLRMLLDAQQAGNHLPGSSSSQGGFPALPPDMLRNGYLPGGSAGYEDPIGLHTAALMNAPLFATAAHFRKITSDLLLEEGHLMRRLRELERHVPQMEQELADLLAAETESLRKMITIIKQERERTISAGAGASSEQGQQSPPRPAETAAPEASKRPAETAGGKDANIPPWRRRKLEAARVVSRIGGNAHYAKLLSERQTRRASSAPSLEGIEEENFLNEEEEQCLRTWRELMSVPQLRVE